jgi:protein-disulfide isomerase
MNTDRLMSVATIILSGCAVVMTATLLHREFAAPVRLVSGPSAPVQQVDWARYAESGHSIGAADAKVTVVEFADFECPYCRRFNLLADSLRAVGKSFRVVYRHFPLPTHRFAIPAARASECASRQGKFAEMHAVLFANSDSLGLAPWAWFADRAGVRDSVRFAACVKETKPIDALVQDTTDGHRLGVTGTPTLLIGSLRVGGLPSFDSLSAYIDRAAAGNRAAAGKQRDE